MITRLGTPHRDVLRALLCTQPVTNLFLIRFLETVPMGRAWWLGYGQTGRLDAALLLIPKRLAVPFAPAAAHAEHMGRMLQPSSAPRILVGPRQACDALWRGWSPRCEIVRWYDQRLYVLDAIAPGAPPAGLRLGRADEWPEIARHSAQMEREDLGIDPRVIEPDEHRKKVKERLANGRTWVMERDGGIAFMVNVGTQSDLGAQIGGTWVPPEHRGKGLAKAGVAGVCRVLMDEYPRVTLHVNEANRPAVRCYERVGFAAADAFRLAVTEVPT